MLKTCKVKILIGKDMTTKIPVDCYAHEIPLYQEAHPDGTILVMEKGEDVELNVAEQYAELQFKFGEDPDSNDYRVDKVYGHGGHQLATGDFTNVEVSPAYQEERKEKSLGLEDVRNLLDKLEVEYKPKMNRDTLMGLLESKAQAMADELEERELYVPDDPLAMKAILDAAAEEDDKAA